MTGDRAMGEEAGRDELIGMLRGAIRQVRSRHEDLSRLDSHGGDGDHGTTMLRAMAGIEKAVDAAPADIAPGPLLGAIGWEVMGIDGGATGPLLGTLLMGMGEAAGDAPRLSAPGLAAALEAGLAAVGKRTKAKPGDKTLMDALIPAVDAARTACAAGAGIGEMLRAAAEAAARGAESTRDMAARFGRAKNLGAKSIGHADPGATSVSLILKGFSEGMHSNG